MYIIMYTPSCIHSVHVGFVVTSCISSFVLKQGGKKTNHMLKEVFWANSSDMGAPDEFQLKQSP